MARSLAAQVILTVITLSRFHESPTEGQGHARKQRSCREDEGRKAISLEAVPRRCFQLESGHS